MSRARTHSVRPPYLLPGHQGVGHRAALRGPRDHRQHGHLPGHVPGPEP